ncbi:MAG TPA: hypothetical protein PLC76_10175 [Saprospiraceae bacterium]|nr:MAG: hypothetical protein UZ08_BCD001002418 [Candidatus Parvibacillus calidus]QLH28191.1 MAG: hypothetical protein HWD63_01550 [Candidatus Parvibacillus calidus]WKZ64697.1 MAG: hypothetical protein QY315_07785 [Saprospiraceae bacterium]HRN32910.1 hypothetical protein [Saprospiraceae bacterium]HRP85077.1 hypothetical protein [Saprospiraceae bacterium]
MSTYILAGDNVDAVTWMIQGIAPESSDRQIQFFLYLTSVLFFYRLLLDAFNGKNLEG